MEIDKKKKKTWDKGSDDHLSRLCVILPLCAFIFPPLFRIRQQRVNEPRFEFYWISMILFRVCVYLSHSVLQMHLMTCTRCCCVVIWAQNSSIHWLNSKEMNSQIIKRKEEKRICNSRHSKQSAQRSWKMTKCPVEQLHSHFYETKTASIIITHMKIARFFFGTLWMRFPFMENQFSFVLDSVSVCLSFRLCPQFSVWSLSCFKIFLFSSK